MRMYDMISCISHSVNVVSVLTYQTKVNMCC